MKAVISVALVVVIISSVLLTSRQIDRLTDVDYLLKIADTLGSREVPSLFGGHDFSSFEEGSQSVAYLVAYPLRLIFYIVAQISTFVTMIKNANHTQGGFGNV